MTKICIIGLSLALLPSISLAQQDHASGEAPREVGQAQFSAIEEMVSILENDPTTNWQTVNIGALREHLVDMDRVMTLSETITKDRDGSIIFEVTGAGETVESIQRMSIAHGSILTQMSNWDVVVSPTEMGAAIEVTGDEENLIKAKALSYYGLLTLGSHHQTHHIMIARGENPH